MLLQYCCSVVKCAAVGFRAIECLALSSGVCCSVVVVLLQSCCSVVADFCKVMLFDAGQWNV